jgi:tyrosine aminotransferase
LLIQQEDKNWEVNLDDIEKLIDDKTAAIIINNPSNPCGSVFSKEHMVDIINLAQKYKLPIIADEVYGEMVIRNYI